MQGLQVLEDGLGAGGADQKMSRILGLCRRSGEPIQSTASS
jgi:hypothetical protein